MLRTWHDKDKARFNDGNLDCVVNLTMDVARLMGLLLYQFLIMSFSRFKQHENILIFMQNKDCEKLATCSAGIN